MRFIQRLFSRQQKETISYCGYGDNPYVLTEYPDSCYVKESGVQIATFETMSLLEKGSVLHIDHFAVHGDLRGQGRAEAIIRGFAQLVARQAPSINQITFDLYRAVSGTDIEQLAQARRQLLTNIGANNVRESRPNRNRICVKGEWNKSSW